MLWILNLADGRHSLDEMEARSGVPRDVLERLVDRLLEADLLRAA